MVATSRTRNAVVRKGTWVRIPPSPPSIPTLVGANKLAECGGLICLPANMPENVSLSALLLQEYTVRLTGGVSVVDRKHKYKL